jgi:L-ascorbate metabolism protein UlaG (beta-lactamase superfamily)
VAFLPCCSDYTIGPEEAVKVGKVCAASVIVPLHWEDNPNGLNEVRRMADLFPGKVELLERKL